MKPTRRTRVDIEFRCAELPVDASTGTVAVGVGELPADSRGHGIVEDPSSAFPSSATRCAPVDGVVWTTSDDAEREEAGSAGRDRWAAPITTQCRIDVPPVPATVVPGHVPIPDGATGWHPVVVTVPEAA